MMSSVQQVTAQNFVSEVIESQVPVLVDFYADWCGPRRILAPALEAVGREFAGRIKVVKVDIDREQSLPAYFRIQSVPTLLAFRGGQLCDRVVGIGFTGQLRQLLIRLAGNSSPPSVRAG